MHKLLERQLRRAYGNLDQVPKELSPLLDGVSEAYDEWDADRRLLERSLDLTSQELMSRNAELRREIVRLANMQDQLRESEERYRRIVETSSEGVWITGEHAETVFVNARMAAMLGYDPKEMLGQRLHRFIRPEDHKELDARIERRRKGEAEQYDFRLLRRDGSELWCLVSATPILDRNGGYKGALGMVTDITDRRKAEESLRAAYKELERLVQFRTQFLNNAAHELATPLTPMILQSHLLRRTAQGAESPSQRRALEIMDRNIHRLSQLVQEVLDAARLQAGRLPLHREPVDLGKLVGESIESFRPLAEEAGIELFADLDGGLLTSADSRRLMQVCFNLVSNALKYTPRGGTVRIKTFREGADVILRVRDSGIGITSEAQTRLFQPFSQVHDARSSPHIGTGLGLYVSRGIVEEHQGTLTCESSGTNKGSTFLVRLPAAPAISRITKVPEAAVAPTTH